MRIIVVFFIGKSYIFLCLNDRWDGKGLSGPSKVIFDVLDDLVRDTTETLVLQGNIDVIEDFRDLVSVLKVENIIFQGLLSL